MYLIQSLITFIDLLPISDQIVIIVFLSYFTIKLQATQLHFQSYDNKVAELYTNMQNTVRAVL